MSRWWYLAGIAVSVSALGIFQPFSRKAEQKPELVQAQPQSPQSQATPTPPSPPGTFYKIDIDIEYKGEPKRISYVVSCNLIESRQRDGDRSVDGAALIPMMWGERMPDGGAIVVKTPEHCDGGTTANGKVDPRWLPLLVHFEKADEPWFGRAYLSDDAYESRLSVMKFDKATVEKARYEDWKAWRETDSPKNVVRWDRTELTPNFFVRRTWTPGTRWMPALCKYAVIVPVNDGVREILSRHWPANKPVLWWDPDTGSEVAAYIRNHGLSAYDGKTPYAFPAVTRINPVKNQKNAPKYPAITDQNINIINSDGIFLREVKFNYNVVVNNDELGFAYCEGFAQPKGVPKEFLGLKEQMAQAIGGYPMQSNSIHWSPVGGYINDTMFIKFEQFQMYQMGGGL